ncbi:MAG: protein phosphatase 2C domain-containing protein [Elusimicrobia bacterium]|nr:protein phosphatase 2C domain-containing protein [Elusimicrobiota bacterium]
MKIEHYEKTDVGRLRSDNQDSLGVFESENLFVVCDGMGGGAAGDFASQLAVEIVIKSFKLLDVNDIKGILGKSIQSDSPEALKPMAAIRLANRALKNYSDKFPRLSGMGTTVSSILFDNKKDVVHIYNVGDSRVYRIRSGRIELLTKDHTKVNELVESGKMSQQEVKNAEIQSMLTRALGTQSTVKIDYRQEKIKPNDCYLLCSDGLNGELEDFTIRDIVSINKDNAESVVNELIHAANNSGGKDNVTVVFVKTDFETASKENLGTEKLAKIVTINEEAQAESISEDKVLKKILPKISVKVPELAKEKNILKSPVYIGTIIAVLLLSFTAFLINSNKSVYNKALMDLTGKVSGVSMEIRSPSKAQLDLFQKSNDNVYKLQLIQDWLKNKGANTIPLGDVYVSVKGKDGAEEFNGISGINPLEIDLPKGNHKIIVKYPGYKIISEKMELKDSIDVSLEYGDSLKPLILFIVPEKIHRRKT